MIRVMIVSAHPEVRKGLRMLLRLASGIEVTGVSGSLESAIQDARADDPDVILVDLEMPEGEGCRTIQQLNPLYPGLKIIAVTAHDYPDARETALLSGADDVILKGMDLQNMLTIIQRAKAHKNAAHKT